MSFLFLKLVRIFKQKLACDSFKKALTVSGSGMILEDKEDC